MHVAYVALGANLPGPTGPPDATLAAALDRLAALGRVADCSSLYSTTPVGRDEQPRFLNAAVALDTSLSPLELLGALLTIERDFGRDRSASLPNGPRTLDLDLILYGDFVLSQSGLEVPHPRFHHRAFVLVPLAQIAPHLRDPRSGSTVSELLQVLLNSSPQESAHAIDAVLEIESDLWRAAVDRAHAGLAPLRRE